MGGAIAIKSLREGGRWFERVVLSAPMLALPSSSPYLMKIAAPVARLMRLVGRGSAYVPGGSSQAGGTENFIGNRLTSDPVRYARNAAVLEAEPDLGVGSPTIAWADSALRLMRQLQEPGVAARIRQPLLMVAAGSDQIVSTAAIENFGMNLLAGRHLIIAGSRHEILQEQDHYRNQFWAAFDAFVPGTPLY
jgi:lysophospholipase